MLERARRRAARAAASVTVVEGRAEELPFADAGFDAAVSAFALCTVADPAAALAELRRVLVPGGTLQLLEHVHLPWEPGRALQSRAAPAWAAVAGGCRLDRDTLRSAREAGFVVVRARTHVAGWVVEASSAPPRPALEATLTRPLSVVSSTAWTFLAQRVSRPRPERERQSVPEPAEAPGRA